MNVHVIGELKGAIDLESPNLSCHYKFIVEAGAKKPGCWLKLDGKDDDWTQLCANLPAVWNHPIDVHYATTSVETWPFVYLEVWTQDEYGRNDIAGYAQVQLPSSPGEHELDAVVWRPRGTWFEELRAFFLGGRPTLLSPVSAMVDARRFHADFRTETVGSVRLMVNVITTECNSKGIVLKR